MSTLKTQLVSLRLLGSGPALALLCAALAFLLLRLGLLPPLISPDTAAGVVEQAREALLERERELQAALASTAGLAGPRGDFEARGVQLALLPEAERPMAARALAGDLRLLAEAARAAQRYREVLQGYDQALMSRTRGLGPGSEALRDDTWPIVEHIKLYPPPLGENRDLQPPDAEQIEAWAATIAQWSELGVERAREAATAMGRSAFALRSTLFDYDRQYRAELDRYADRLEAAIAEQAQGTHVRHLLGLLCALLLVALLALALALLAPPSARDAEAGQPSPAALAVAAGALGIYYLLPGLPTALAGATLLLLAFLRWPATALALIPAAIPFYYRPRQIGPLSFNLGETLILIAVAATLLRWIWSLRREAGFRHDPLRWVPPSGFRLLFTRNAYIITFALALLFLVGALLSFLSPLLVDSHIAVRELRRMVVEPLLFCGLLLAAGSSPRGLALGAFIISSAFVAADALVQMALGSGIWQMEGVPRLIGLLPSSTALGILLGAALAAALGKTLSSAERRPRLAYGIFTLVLSVATLLTFTRGAWFGVIAAVVVLLAVRRSWRALLIASALAALGLGGLSLLGAERFQTMFSLSQGTGAARREIWASALGIAGETPLLGIGLDQFSYQDTQRFAVPQIRFLQISHPHNVVLDLWLQVGLLGMLAMLLLLGLSLWRLARRARQRDGWVLAAIALLVDMVVHGMLDQVLLGADMLLLFWIAVALALPSYGVDEPLITTSIRSSKISAPSRAE